MELKSENELLGLRSAACGFHLEMLYERSLFVIYALTVGFYAFMNFYNQKKALNSFRRKIQIATWNNSGDPSVFGRLEVDMTKIDDL